MRILIVAALGAVLVLAATVAVVAIAGGDEGPRLGAGPFRGSEPPDGITMPVFALRDQQGRTIRSTVLRGKVVVLTFLDTKCREACPVIAGQIVSTWGLLDAEERQQAVAVAISTDPRDDTPGAIAAFLRTHRAGGIIRYLAGPVAMMTPLWQRFQILSSLASGDAGVHSAPVRIYGRDGVWLATQHAGADLSPENLAADVRTALATR